MHGNNKSDEELRAAAEADALVVLDALDEPARAAAAGVRRVLVRVTPGVDAETHEAIRTGHHGSKFGLDADEALDAVATRARAGLDVEGLHVHVGSQLADVQRAPGRRSRCSPSSPRAAATSSTGRPRVVDVGGGFGIRHVEDEPEPPVEELVRSVAAPSTRELGGARLAGAEVWSRARPLRSSGRPAFTLYRVGAVKRRGDRRYVAIDGGMSDNPRPQLYQARYSALLANRADEEPRTA